MRARYYDPSTGRFISRDPLNGSLTNPQSQNPYAYSLNNPINYSDPSGQYAETPWDAANLAYDFSNFDRCDPWSYINTGYDLLATVVPVLPAGLTKIPQVIDKASDVLRFNANQDALIQIAKEAEKKGVSQENAKTLLDWAEEYSLPARGPEVHPNRPYGQIPHIHIGPVDHILIK